MNVEVWGGFHFPPAQKSPVNSSNNSQSHRAFGCCESVTDVRLRYAVLVCLELLRMFPCSCLYVQEVGRLLFSLT